MDSFTPLKYGMLNKRHGGFTLHEVIGALAIGSIMMAGLTVFINNSLDDAQSQQAALYQSQVATAASKYITDNYSTLLAGASTTTPTVIHLATLTAAESYLASSIGVTNAYGQTPCVYVLKTSGNTLEALVVTEGGNPIPARDLPYAAANAGQSGGYIRTNAASGLPEAAGAFGSWAVGAATLANYLPSVANSCSGTPASANRLASALFFNGPGTPNNQYVYRNFNSGRQDLNTMSTPLYFSYAGATDGGTDGVCNALNMVAATSSTGASTRGAITTDASGEVLSCQNGKWERQKNTYWRDPVTNYASLPASGSNIGEVRLVQKDDSGATIINRAYSWTGAAWAPLSIDKDGNLNVPNRLTATDMLLSSIQTESTACTPDGLVARDATGTLLSCKSGIWSYLFSDNVAYPPIVEGYWLKKTIDGNATEHIDLEAISGKRPLFTSGFAYCNSEDLSHVVGAVEIRNASDQVIGWAGGCGASTIVGGATLSKGFMPLTKIPANARYLRVTWAPRNGDADNSVEIQLYIYNSL